MRDIPGKNFHPPIIKEIMQVCNQNLVLPIARTEGSFSVSWHATGWAENDIVGLAHVPMHVLDPMENCTSCSWWKQKLLTRFAGVVNVSGFKKF